MINRAFAPLEQMLHLSQWFQNLTFIKTWKGVRK